MLKKNKWTLVVTTLVVLLPILVGVILWDKLPEMIATHWGVNGEPDGWSKKASAVFGLPVFLCAIHWVCIWATSQDKKNKAQSDKIMALTLWICPVISVGVHAAVYAEALGKSFNAMILLPVLLGLLFVFIGNLMPKCRQNSTIGIKVKWTLENEANWNATHRMAGKLWVIGGAFLLLCVFLPEAVLPWVVLSVITVMVVVPTVYSYRYSKKNP